jgi:hypothetical protein
VASGAVVSRTGASSGKPLIIQDFTVCILTDMAEQCQRETRASDFARLPAIALHIGKPAAMRRGPTTLPGAR